MLRVTIEVVHHGDESHSETIATGKIVNDGTGTLNKGNYRVELYDRAGRLWRFGEVRDFPRRRLLAWDLLHRALTKLVTNRN